VGAKGVGVDKEALLNELLVQVELANLYGREPVVFTHLVKGHLIQALQLIRRARLVDNVPIGRQQPSLRAVQMNEQILLVIERRIMNLMLLQQAGHAAHASHAADPTSITQVFARPV